MIRLVLSGLWFHRRAHLGVMLGTALATAVLTGSLLVGDSVDGSLREAALMRLGAVQQAMVLPDRFVSARLAERLPAATGVLHLPGMALTEERQINRVEVYGCTEAFGVLAGTPLELQPSEAALNEKLAAALDLQVGDEVSLRVEKPGLLPRDAPLAAQQDDQTVRGRFRVMHILSDEALGRFSLTPSQIVPYNAFVSREWLAERTEQAGRVNLIVSTADESQPAFSTVWQPADLGLRFRETGGLLQLEADGIYLDPEAVRAARSIGGARGTLTYLVNSLSSAGGSTPYSFVLAHEGAPLKPDEMIVNRWLADELQLQAGDAVILRYFALLPSNAFEERERVFTVKQIAEMDELAAERELAPRFPGLSDVDRCADWDAGIPMVEEQLEDEANEAYWEAYRQTPKAIVSLEAGQSMWSNRFGSLTSVRWMNPRDQADAFRQAYDPAAAGYVFRSVREEALEAVEQAMDFGQLFVGMSFFLIVAALLLTGLLFVFGIQRRAEEMGILLAVGWPAKQVRRLLLLEGGLAATLGAAAGAALGIGYTRLLIAGISGWWSGAVAQAGIGYHGRPQTVLIGALAGLICAMAALMLAIRRQTRCPARMLLTADFSQEFSPEGPARRKRKVPGLPWILTVAAMVLAIYAQTAELRSVTLPFFGAGALLLTAGLLFFGRLLDRLSDTISLEKPVSLALRNAVRRRGRSLAVVGVLACGCFLVFAVSSMKEDIRAHADESWSGTGGFKWFGTSTLPIHEPIGAVRIRVRDGDDASCLNLNRARTPQVLGADPEVMASREAFMDGENIWALLQREYADGVVPALVGDSDTALWGLEAVTDPENGDELEYVDDRGRPFTIRLVGRLPMRLSVFQGSLLISERDFTRRFPSESGWRMFLMDEPVDAAAHARAGLDVVPAVERLMEFYAVESTYLAMFLVLGALGLAVGSFGTGIVVLRNVEERRAENALLRAVGYEAGTLRRILLLEHGLLLLAGLGIGAVASAVAMWPAFAASGSRVPVGLLGSLLLFTAGCGAACTLWAVRAALRDDPLRGLRNE